MRVQLPVLSQLKYFVGLEQAHHGHKPHQRAHHARDPSAVRHSSHKGVYRIADHQQGAGHRGADQDHGRSSRRKAAAEHQPRHQQLSTVRRIHRKEDVEEEERDIKADGRAHQAPEQAEPDPSGMVRETEHSVLSDAAPVQRIQRGQERLPGIVVREIRWEFVARRGGDGPEGEPEHQAPERRLQEVRRGPGRDDEQVVAQQLDIVEVALWPDAEADAAEHPQQNVVNLPAQVSRHVPVPKLVA
mmetsp:Transcript_49423/g.127496  ORF Transcript_49423/g.127496 Transcript_49423/m.127496 type:complete len:244 (-) Transcript_49423:316-1047(-)